MPSWVADLLDVPKGGGDALLDELVGTAAAMDRWNLDGWRDGSPHRDHHLDADVRAAVAAVPHAGA